MRSIARVRVFAATAALFVVLTGTQAGANSTSTWPYPQPPGPHCGGPLPHTLCFNVPAGAVGAHVVVTDDRSAHVSSGYQVYCWVDDGSSAACTEFTEFCDQVTVSLPASAARLFVVPGVVDAAWGAVTGSRCADAMSFATTGTVTTTWIGGGGS